jgi:hypothetical protein
MQLDDIILSEVSKAQKDKGRMFCLICGRESKKINIYTKTNMIIYKHSVTTLWNLREEGKEKRMLVNNIKMHYICAGRGYNNVY